MLLHFGVYLLPLYFLVLNEIKRQRFPKSRKAMMYAALAGIF